MVCEGKRVCANCAHYFEKHYYGTGCQHTDRMCTRFATKKCDVVTGEVYWDGSTYCSSERRKPRNITGFWDKLMGKPRKLEDICGTDGRYFEEKKNVLH